MTQNAGRTRSSVRAESTSIDISSRDLTLDIARVTCVILVVVIHLLMVGVGVASDGELIVSRPLENQTWFAAATWVGQIMPLFFVVGGFASLTAWRSLQRRGGGAAQYVRNRVLRLAQPALPLFLFYVVVVGVARFVIGVDPAMLDTVVSGAGFPLWFLAAYTLCQSLVPFMAGMHARAPIRTVLVLLAAVILVDTLRFSTGITEVGLLNLAFVWLLAQQFGFWYADGWFAARNGWQLFGIAVGSYLLLYLIIGVFKAPYSWDMLANLNPATLPLVLLALASFMLGESVSRVRYLMAALGFCGVLVMVRPDASAWNMGLATAFAAVLLGSVAIVQTRRLARENTTVMMLFYTVGLSAFTAIPAALVWAPVPLEAAPSIVLVGVLAQLGQYCWLQAYQKQEARLLAPIGIRNRERGKEAGIKIL